MKQLEQKLNKDFTDFFKAGKTNEKNFLGLIKSEITTLQKNIVKDELSDEEVMKILLKIKKGLVESLSFKQDEQLINQLSLLDTYLPKQLSKDEVTIELKKIIESGITNIGQIMKQFSDKPVDKKMLSELVKQELGT